MKRKMEDLEKWRDVALAMTTADNLGHVISDASDTSLNKSQPSVNIDFLDSEPYTAASPPQQLLLPINTPQLLQYGPGSSVPHANSQPSVAAGIDDMFSLDWNTSVDPATILAYDARLPSPPKKPAREGFSPSYVSLPTTRQRSKSVISMEDSCNESLRRGTHEQWSRSRTVDVCIP
jgi:hypothetical protein